MSVTSVRFRELLAKGGCISAAPIFDPLSARIADILGWEVAKLSGSVAKAANLALPDIVSVAIPTDLAAICRRIVAVTGMSLVVDADDAGPTVLNVVHTVQELEAAGVCAIEIEDNR